MIAAWLRGAAADRVWLAAREYPTAEFAQKRPGTIRQECGPFRVAEVTAEAVIVFEGFHPLTLASRTPSGKWVVNGLDGLEFDYFLVLPPRDQAQAEFDALLEASEGGDVEPE